MQHVKCKTYFQNQHNDSSKAYGTPKPTSRQESNVISPQINNGEIVLAAERCQDQTHHQEESLTQMLKHALIASLIFLQYWTIKWGTR
jgi:ssRNA-specific RNase YbeY (16S rRNA maturation enzyme)